jgi:hypothetical protein
MQTSLNTAQKILISFIDPGEKTQLSPQITYNTKYTPEKLHELSSEEWHLLIDDGVIKFYNHKKQLFHDLDNKKAIEIFEGLDKRTNYDILGIQNKPTNLLQWVELINDLIVGEKKTNGILHVFKSPSYDPVIKTTGETPGKTPGGPDSIVVKPITPNNSRAANKNKLHRYISLQGQRYKIEDYTEEEYDAFLTDYPETKLNIFNYIQADTDIIYVVNMQALRNILPRPQSRVNQKPKMKCLYISFQGEIYKIEECTEEEFKNFLTDYPEAELKTLLYCVEKEKYFHNIQDFRNMLTQQQSPLNQKPETKIIPEDNKIQYPKAYEQKPTQYDLKTNQKVDMRECNKYMITQEPTIPKVITPLIKIVNNDLKLCLNNQSDNLYNIQQLKKKEVESYQGNLQQNTLPQRQSLLNPVINFFSCPFILFKNGVKAIYNTMYNWINKNSEHSKKQ